VVPKDERLVSYAIDLGTEVEPVAKRDPDRLTKVKVNKGILYQTTKVRESKAYTVKNRSEHDRAVLLEHPFPADFSLVSKEMPPTAEAYKRYLKKFDDQETQIEDFQKKVKALQDAEFVQRKAFEDYLAKLDIE